MTKIVEEILENVSVLRDLVQIWFFIAVGTVTVLTYFKARRTLMQPIRTEVFKEQVKVFSDLLGEFTGKSELDLRDDFGFEHVFEANCVSMMDEFARLIHGLEIDESQRPYSNERCPGAIIHEKLLRYANESNADPSHNEREKELMTKEDRIRMWKEYEHSIIRVPTKYRDAEQKLRKILDSPLLPIEFVSLGEEYLSTVNKNLIEVAEVMKIAATELPERYQSRESLRTASLSWVWNRYNSVFVDLSPTAKKITKSIREYYSSDGPLRP